MAYGMAGRDFQGDPFLGGLIKKGLGALVGVGKRALGIQPPPTLQLPPGFGVPVMPGGQVPRGTVTKTKGVKGALQRAIPGGATGFQVTGARRRRINPANPKALRRAIRRQDGFVKLARRALKGSGYTIVTRGSRRPKRDLGAGHTHVR